MKVLIGVSEFEKGFGVGSFVYKFVNNLKQYSFSYDLSGGLFLKKINSKLYFAVGCALGYSTSWGPALELFSGIFQFLTYFLYFSVCRFQLLLKVAS